ncbi:DNA/RNA helicase-like protein [Bacillus phage Shbh1]|uniref:DNA/RNA helicase-like protein n=1 Tax=Bacillus phage Shbh1 TaxID=1796992 RepID=A0A142F183_9CAUD|nr:DNA/RNA helicase-like protein [Bacillus phage Shbh1]AMQ66540.1 DNA/RNA helicase-like protein [Bacillus phage Shbh1]
MVRVTERYYIKKINKLLGKYYGKQQRKRTTYWLFWILPIFSKDEVVSGDYED